MSSRSASALLDAALAVPFDPEQEDQRQLRLAAQEQWPQGPVEPSVVDVAPEVQQLPPAPMQIAPESLIVQADAAMEQGLEPALPQEDEDLPPVTPPGAGSMGQGANQGGGRRSASALLAGVADEPAAAAPAPVRSADQALPEQVRPRRSAAALLAEVPEGPVNVEGQTILGTIGNAFKRGWTMGDLAREMEAPQPNADRVFALQQEMQKLPPSPEYMATMNDDLAPQESWNAFKSNPVGVLGELMGESLAAFGNQMIEKAPNRVAIGLGAGAAMGASVAGIGAVPGGFMGAGAGFSQASGAASYALEMSGGILEALEKSGVPMDDPQAMRAALADPERMQVAREFAQRKAVPIAIFDGGSALIAGRLGGKPASALAKVGQGFAETFLQGAMGAGGEASGQLAQSGEIRSARAILAEAVAEVPTGLAEIGVGALTQNAADANRPAGTAPAAAAAAPTGVQAPWQAAREQVAPTVTQVEVVGDDVFGEPTTAAVERPVATGDERFAPPAEAAAPAQAVPTETETPVGRDGAATTNPYRTPEGQIQVPFRASSNFDQSLQQFEDRMRAIVNDPATSDAAYNEIPDSKGGKVIGTDIYRNVLPEYAQGREGRIGFVNATGRVAQAAAKDRLWRELNNRGDRKVLLFTAGGVAAGKSTAVTDAMTDRADLVFDGTLRETEWGKQTIQQALDNGWDIEINYVQRPLNLVARGAIRRAQQEGRWGPYASVPDTHAGAQASIIDISKAFPDNPRVKFKYFLNDGLTPTDKGKILSLKDIDRGGKYSYDATDERISQRQDLAGRPDRGQLGSESKQSAEQGQESGGGSPFAWRVRGYSPAEHLEIFREAARSGDFEPRILRLLAAGNPALEQVVGEQAPAKAKTNIQRKLRPDAGAIDLSILEDLVEYGRTIYRAGMDYATWAAAMTREFGARVGQFLRQAFDRIVAAYQASRFSDTTGAVGDVRPKAKARQFEAKARQNEALAPETRARLGSEYIPISLNAQAEAAKDWINTNGLEAAKLRIAQLSGNDTTPTPLDFAIGTVASGRLSATGDHAGAAGIVSTMSQRATSLGQTISVLAMMARLTPEGIVLYGQNIVNRYINTLPQEAQDRIKALQAEVDRLRTAMADMKFKKGSEVIRSGKLGDEKIQDRIKRRVKARVQADLGPAAAGPEVTAETQARTSGLNRQVRDVLLSDAKQSEMIKQITQILTSQGNMSPAEAEAVGKSIVAAFTRIVTETRRNYVQGAKRGTKGLRKGNFDKLLKMLNEQKDMSDAEFVGQVSRLMGIPGMTAQMARELKALGQRYENATDPDVKMVIGAMMFEKAHELLPVEFWVKVRGFSYLAMLFAPKTWIRNLGGNQIQWIADVGRDAAVSGAVDPAMSMITGKRTSVGLNLGPRLRGLMAPIEDVRKGYLWSKQENPTFNFRNNFMAGVNHLRVLSKLTTQNKFEIADVRNVGGQIFSSKFMRFWDAGLSIALGAGDRAFWMSAFRASLAKMERAAIANGEWTGQPPPEMIEAAMAEAAYAIYQNPTVLGEAAKGVREWVNWGSTLGQTKQFGLGTGLLAFVQVPAAIAMRGMVEWSPLGLINSFYKGMRGILYASSSGRIGAKFDQAAFNKAFTQALLGSGIYASGFWLYSLGVLTASQEDDDDLEAMRRASGTGAYRINLTALRRALLSGNWFTRQEGEQGDLIVPYDWAQPLAITVAAGAELAAQMDRADRKQLKKGLGDRAGMAAMSLVAGAKSLEELPLLSGLSSFIKSWGYGGPLQAITSTVAGMPSMFVPQIVRQAGQLNDNMLRETRGGDSVVQREFMKVLASIPGYSTKFPLRFDITGQAIQRYQYGGNNVLNVFFSPAMASEVKRNPVLQEVSRLVDTTGGTEMVPKQVKRRTRINGVDVDLTNDQLAAYSYYLGNFTMSHFAWRMAAPVYARLPDEVKVKMLAQDITDIDAAVKSAVLGGDMRRLTRNQMFLRQALVNSPLGQSVPPK